MDHWGFYEHKDAKDVQLGKHFHIENKSRIRDRTRFIKLDDYPEYADKFFVRIRVKFYSNGSIFECRLRGE